MCREIDWPHLSPRHLNGRLYYQDAAADVKTDSNPKAPCLGYRHPYRPGQWPNECGDLKYRDRVEETSTYANFSLLLELLQGVPATRTCTRTRGCCMMVHQYIFRLLCVTTSMLHTLGAEVTAGSEDGQFGYVIYVLIRPKGVLWELDRGSGNASSVFEHLFRHTMTA
ncbi:hypothetical protein TNCV_4886691 [Trichonephila clavipes]|uniref:Uncharacterized protein n=1 Tax=Trichonephila clavipes TaxID=2585209 RepID=A0A8X6V1I3_TRICX|nr:hypothetical protein TNCV_4886691 [Trichonephila clavipes]